MMAGSVEGYSWFVRAYQFAKHSFLSEIRVRHVDKRAFRQLMQKFVSSVRIHA